MGNDWKIAIGKVVKDVLFGGVAVGVLFFSQIDAQCPGASLTAGGAVISIKVVLDFLANIYKHKDD